MAHVLIPANQLRDLVHAQRERQRLTGRKRGVAEIAERVLCDLRDSAFQILKLRRSFAGKCQQATRIPGRSKIHFKLTNCPGIQALP